MIEDIVLELNLKLKVAYIDGDDLMPELSKLNESGEEIKNIDTNASLLIMIKKL